MGKVTFFKSPKILSSAVIFKFPSLCCGSLAIIFVIQSPRLVQFLYGNITRICSKSATPYSMSFKNIFLYTIGFLKNLKINNTFFWYLHIGRNNAQFSNISPRTKFSSEPPHKTETADNNAAVFLSGISFFIKTGFKAIMYFFQQIGSKIVTGQAQ